MYGHGYIIEDPKGNYQVYAKLTDAAEGDSYAE